MRILHTSDWHIGRSFHGHATLDALRGVLAALAVQVRAHDVDVVVVAGDVFDSATPAAACFPVLTEALLALRDAGAQVVVTSGNHDSSARLGFQSALLREGIHVVTDPATVGTPITIGDADGPVHFYGIPYLEPTMVRSVWPGVELRAHAQTLTHAMGLIRADLAARGGRSVAIAHCFAAGVAPTPQLERDIQQGGLDVIPLSVFDGVDYMALGHIHGRQQLAETVRYAGAPLHYSFGEAGKPRGSWLVELDAGGFASARWLELPVPRRLVSLRGTLDELLTDPAHEAHRDDWVCAVLTDPTPQIDPMRKLQSRFAWCANIKLDPQGAPEGDRASYADRVRDVASDPDLIGRFLSHVRAGQGPDDQERALIQDAVAEERVSELHL
ncbi:exonuclease SbcCD subunit D [uncultured Microbacterium sp.]|uniref:exonuclease SbcCD subunit D n=1 Tax=uncultured Microbacterium sp. TaxID=191216 RepID=UPI0035CC48AD